MSDDETFGDVGYVEDFDWSAGLDKGSLEKDDSPAKTYYGKYRGTVINNVDPKKEGRVMVQVPDVLGLGISSWAMPCFPFTGIECGVYIVPAIQSGVWVEFEQGNPEKPIWVGGFWGTAAEVPKTSMPAVPGLPAFIVQTPAQNAIAVHDSPIPPGTGGVLLKSLTGSINVGPDAISIMAPTINIVGNVNILGNLTGVGVVDFNVGALKVT